MSVTVGAIARAIEDRFPHERAEVWDKVGLLAGDPDSVVTGVSLALDPSHAAIAAAAEAGANVLVTHHPAFLETPAMLTPGRGAGGVLYAAISAGVALVNAHTNLDRDPKAQLLLPEALGLTPTKPLERSLAPMSVVTVYVPEQAANAVASAMSGAGAGRIGDYQGCEFRSFGTGSFTPSAEAVPFAGTPGAPSSVDETRLEMVAPRTRTRGVVAAAVAAHPYEEPLITVSEVAIARNAARLGMVSQAPQEWTLSDLAAAARDAFGSTPRVWGSPYTTLSRIATTTGSGGSLIGEAFSARAQALVCGEVRYHDALDAAEAGLCIVELGHDVSEWPLVALLEQVVRGVQGIDPQRIHVQPAHAGWWTP